MVLGGMKNSHTAPGCLYDKGVNICNPYELQYLFYSWTDAA